MGLEGALDITRSLPDTLDAVVEWTKVSTATDVDAPRDVTEDVAGMVECIYVANSRVGNLNPSTTEKNNGVAVGRW